jgi:hypothetical protein
VEFSGEPVRGFLESIADGFGGAVVVLLYDLENPRRLKAESVHS